MRLRSITLSNVRRFTRPVRIDGITDGINVLAAPNESGKSTVFDALTQLLLTAHGSKGESVRSLRPHAGRRPEVTAEIETAEGRFTLHKRWFSKARATVHRDGQLIAQADAAEAWLAALVGGDGLGPSGLLWVRQGESALDEAPKKAREAGLETRRDLLSSVQGEVEAMTGGRRMDAVLRACEAELARYQTATGRVSASGPLGLAEAEATRLAAEEAALAEIAEGLSQALEARRAARRELAELQDPEAVAAHAARMREAEAALAAAEQHAMRLAQAQSARDLAHHGAQAAAQDLARGQKARAEAAAALEGLAKAEAAAKTAQAQADAASAQAAQAAQGLAQAEAKRAAAEQDRQELTRQERIRAGAARRRDVQARLTEAEAARKEAETAHAAAQIGPDAKGLDALAARDAALVTARALRDRGAVKLCMAYAPGQAGSAQLNGRPLEDGVWQPILEDARIELGPLGLLSLQLGQGAQGPDGVTEAEAALRALLDRYGAADLPEARAAGAARAQAEQQFVQARARLEALAPEGLDALRRALAEIPEAEGDAVPLDPAAVEAAWSAAGSGHIAAQQARDVAQDELARAGAALSKALAEQTAAQDRHRRAQEACADLVAPEAAEARVVQTQAALAEAEAARAQHAQDAPDLALAQARRDRARAVISRTQEAIGRCDRAIASADREISLRTGEAVEQRLAATRDARIAAEAHRDRLRFEHEMLRCLEQTLSEARAAARDRYFAPIGAGAQADAGAALGRIRRAGLERRDAFAPSPDPRWRRRAPGDPLGRHPRATGATRAACLWAAAGRAGPWRPVILDDALVYTDDRRIERIFDALTAQAPDLQILVLSCRQSAFRALGGTALRFQELSDDAAPPGSTVQDI